MCRFVLFCYALQPASSLGFDIPVIYLSLDVTPTPSVLFSLTIDKVGVPAAVSRQILSMQKIDKHYTGVHALRQVDFDLDEGEIHALVGENGAGKSTLMKVLIGIVPKDYGEIHYLGHQFNPRDPKHTLQMGIGIIHQELNMMYHLTVAENIFIGRESTQWNGILLDKREQNRRTEELFSIMRDLAARGVGLVHITHRLDEIHRIADRVTVLRDGERVDTKPTSDVTKPDIINMMVGRVIYEQPKEHSNTPPDAPVVLRVDRLNAGRMVRDWRPRRCSLRSRPRSRLPPTRPIPRMRS